jgi:ferritin-like metal-binding protein YciE
LKDYKTIIMANEEKDPALKMPAPARYGWAEGNSPLEKFFIEALKDIYWAEKQLLNALPKMQKATTTEELNRAIGEHITQTEQHVKRIEKVFEICGRQAVAKKCFVMEGLMKESDSIVEETEEGTMTRDAAVILAAQKVEHYEIATYGGLVEYARTLGLNEAHGLLQATLDEEKAADQGLTAIAQNGINWEAEIEDVKDESAALR